MSNYLFNNVIKMDFFDEIFTDLSKDENKKIIFRSLNVIYILLLMNNVLEPNNEKGFTKIEYDRFRETKDSIITYQNIPQNSELCKFDIYCYYLSWLLRGDDPEFI